MKRAMFLCAAALAGAASGARAEDCAAPCLSYAVGVEVEDDWIFSADPWALRGNDLGPTVDVTTQFIPFENFKIVSATTTEAVLDPVPGKDRAFEDIGSYVEQLYGQAAFEPVTVRAGKLNPIFGLATEVLDGISATDLVGDYDNKERWGGEAIVDFEAWGMNRSVAVSAFTTDRTALSNSIFTRRGRLRLSDGGAGNAEGIASFAAVYDACKGAETRECFADGDYGYRLGFRYQEAGHATEDQIEEEIVPRDEHGFLAAATARHEIDDETALRFLGEAAYFEHFDGAPDDVLIGTGSTALEIGQLTLAATYSVARNLVAGGPDTWSHLADLTAIYDFGEDYSLAGEAWKLGGGYAFARDGGGESAHKLSVVLTVDFEGDVSLAQ